MSGNPGLVDEMYQKLRGGSWNCGMYRQDGEDSSESVKLIKEKVYISVRDDMFSPTLIWLCEIASGYISAVVALLQDWPKVSLLEGKDKEGIDLRLFELQHNPITT
ncbi:hypothetical protein DUI87_20415 [Hirundo rustica rustica]|uniref:Uncharacterized protein n=1 Tax=Hirundo rustica rustica TaxID=333673 RepID=A0A3M0JSM5_HIRRU|nr:hypothetical protein DUI87_20415 [Hirundo rustica rustica]